MSKNKNGLVTRDRAADPRNLTAAPHDEELKLALRRELNKLSVNELQARLARQVRENRVTSDRGNRDLSMITRILDTGGTSTGSVLARVDLEQTIYSLFVKAFPIWDRIRKGPANGLKHS